MPLGAASKGLGWCFGGAWPWECSTRCPSKGLGFDLCSQMGVGRLKVGLKYSWLSGEESGNTARSSCLIMELGVLFGICFFPLLPVSCFRDNWNCFLPDVVSKYLF